jgi:hypothetical protein
MNRELRRRIQKAGVSDDLLMEILNVGRLQALDIYSVCLAMVAHDKLDFGQVRVQRLLNDISELFDSVVNKYASLDDFIAVLAEKGITFEERV